MRYHVRLEDGTELEVDIATESGGAPVVQIDGRAVACDLHAIGPDEYSLLIDGRVLRFGARDEPEGLTLDFGSRSSSIRVETDRERMIRRTRKPRVHAAGPRRVGSDMAGIVVRVLVAAGGEVKTGDPLVVIEAMKMENEVRAPSPGKVTAVHVEERTTVQVGDALVTLE